MATKFKTITAKRAKFDIKPLVKAVEKTIDYGDKEFGKTYSTFDHKPGFDKDVREIRGKIVGSTTTTGEGSRDNPYPFVTRGTRVRYATMTPDFTAKTKPRVIGSGQGSGGLAYVDKRRPRPGIKAREFEPEVAKKTEPKFKKNAQSAMKEVAKKSGHKL